MRTVDTRHRGAAAGALAILLMLAGCSAEQGEEATAKQGASAHDTHAEAGDIGKVDFRVSCAKEARPSFDHALGMLHHMMYEQAREEFARVSTDHPDCAMAYWGEATTLFQPLWPTRPTTEDLKRGWELTQKAREIGSESGREQRLLAATEAFFRDPDRADWWTRIRRWAEGMQVAYEALPDDTETAALYALSRLALAYVAEDRAPLHAEAAGILLAIWDREPTHPGAVHYTIHTNDAEGRGSDSPEVVGSYGEIAPDVPHALHMPTHIQVRLGRWPEVIKWNARSAAAALRQPAGDEVSPHYLHAVDYQVYAHLQQGKDREANAIFERAMAVGRHQPGFVAAFHLAAMPARLALEPRDWARAAALTPRTPDYLPWDTSIWAEGLAWFARGVGAARTGDLQKAEQSEQRLAELRGKAEAAGEKGFATYIEVDRMILAGWIAHAQGKPEEAVGNLRAAAELEGTVEKHPVTPGAVYPPYEALGDLLLALDRPTEALAAYQSSDRRWPGRYNTLLGAGRAAEAGGRREDAHRQYSALLRNAGQSERAGVAEAKRFVELPPS